MARIALITDAWTPQVSGVVRTLQTTATLLRQGGHDVEVIEPSAYWSVPTPFYPEIPICMPRPGRIAARLWRFRPDHIHIATEGGLGLAARYVIRRWGWRFTTSYHTRFPEYLRRLAGVPEEWVYRYLRWFHRPAAAILVATATLEAELNRHGFTPPKRRWLRGVDPSIFHPRPRPPLAYPRPIMLYVGRVSHEKGIEDFLRLPLPGTKWVVGDGPARRELQQRYPQAVFLGYRHGAELGEIYAAADVFVFPSRTDTFGIVLIEALACGLPVAAYPVPGPQDIVTDPRWGALDEDLARAVRRALERGDRAACATEGRRYTWPACTQQFLAALVPVRDGQRS